MTERKSVLILGASGMLGNAMVRVLARDAALDVVAATRNSGAERYFAPDISARFVSGADAESPDSLANLLARIRPSIVINCVGVVKQLDDAKSVLASVPINSLLPHRLARLCAIGGARLIHVSTDCVFSGSKGNYLESDTPDATDVYGLSKLLGEVAEPHTITLRTSIIGHELRSGHSLLEWFLAQESRTRGFTKAIFSGLPTVELARVVSDHVLPNPQLSGLYHVSVDPIAKFDLLTLIARQYGKDIVIDADDSLVIDRSLNSDRFRAATGYVPPSWHDLIATMHQWR